jgi:fucose 4-O-acetylase-like acetyltransferase
MTLQDRDASIDIIKAIGIICMVGGHCWFPITRFIYLFHMAIFFIASGYLYNTHKTDTAEELSSFIERKFINLWIPYVLWAAVYSLLHNFFITINVYTDNPLIFQYAPDVAYTTESWSFAYILKNIIKACFFQGDTTLMGTALWFFATLMEISVTYGIIDFVLKRIFHVERVLIVQTVISVVFLILGYGCFLSGHSFLGGGRVLSYYILFHGGYLLKLYNFSGKERKRYVHIMIFIFSYCILLICNKFGAISLIANSYENPVFLLIVSFVGWQFVYELAYFFQMSSKLKTIMVIIGQNTRAVVILNYLCFKIVNYAGVLIKGESHFLVAAYPVLYSGSYWWIAYMVCGLGIPIILSMGWKKIKG